MRRLLRPSAETVMVYGLLGWCYVAICAAARPQDLSEHIAVVLPLRRDTFGCVCFVASAVAAAVLQTGTGRVLVPRRCGVAAADAVLRTTAGYALLVWLYLCTNSLTHPDTIGRRLTHFAPEPTEGTTAVVCFVGSAAAFCALRLRGLRAVASG